MLTRNVRVQFVAGRHRWSHTHDVPIALFDSSGPQEHWKVFRDAIIPITLCMRTCMPRAGVKCCVCAAPYTLIIFCTKMMLSHPTDPHKLVKVEPTYDKPAYKRALTAAYVKISCNCGLLDCSWGSTCEVCGKAEDLKLCDVYIDCVLYQGAPEIVLEEA
jgi:hypothetical protein